MAEAEVPPPGVVIVEDRNIGPFAETVRVGTHVLSADEPVSAGGTNTGPSPYDYVLAGPLEFRTVSEDDGPSHEVLTGEYASWIGSWQPSRTSWESRSRSIGSGVAGSSSTA